MMDCLLIQVIIIDLIVNLQRGLVLWEQLIILFKLQGRSPPADIFVWGVHPDTTKEDIVADLADSSIIITENDIEKKSKNEAFLVSYKIRVKAEDLQKALNPAIWPLRVKVREYVYYSNKKQEKKNSDQNVANAGPNSDNQNSGSSVGSGQSMDQGGLLAVQNRYDALDRDVGAASKV